MCQFPFNESGWEVYFCIEQGTTNYTCPTPSGDQLCENGKE